MLVPMMVEQAVEEVATLIRQQLNKNIDTVYEKYGNVSGDAGTINVPRLPLDRIYVSDAIEPLLLPAVFIVVDRSEHDLSAGNVIKQTHYMSVSILSNEREINRLTRMTWRYALAAHMTLHDQHVGTGAAPTCHILVTDVSYSPTYRSRGTSPDTGNRAFRKDVTLELKVLQYEAFQLY